MTLPCWEGRHRPMWQPSAVSSGILEDDATTIMLRSLPASTSLRSLLQMLEPLGRGVYDFVYLPRCTRQRHRIVELAFLNFVDPVSAQAAAQIFFRYAHSEPSWGRTRISQARLQGLPNNLAYYCLRFGPDAPLDGSAGARDAGSFAHGAATPRHGGPARQRGRSQWRHGLAPGARRKTWNSGDASRAFTEFEHAVARVQEDHAEHNLGNVLCRASGHGRHRSSAQAGS
eukprot:s2005_g15.t1